MRPVRRAGWILVIFAGRRLASIPGGRFEACPRPAARLRLQLFLLAGGHFTRGAQGKPQRVSLN